MYGDAIFGIRAAEHFTVLGERCEEAAVGYVGLDVHFQEVVREGFADGGCRGGSIPRRSLR